MQLDGSDHGGHFAVSVVELATSCQLLLYACLALSARHLSNTSNSMPVELAEDYHERCIAILLPTLTHEDFRTSLDTLLAATVILRLFEQISCIFLAMLSSRITLYVLTRIVTKPRLHSTTLKATCSQGPCSLPLRSIVQSLAVLRKRHSGPSSSKTFSLLSHTK